MEALAIEVATKLATEIIIDLISIAKTAIRCQAECRKLQVKLEAIQADVAIIERLLQELQQYAKQDLPVVENWLSELKQELHVARIEVHKCTRGSKISRHCNVPKNYMLSTKLTAQREKIMKLADQRVQINLQLLSMRNEVLSTSDNQGSREFLKWNSEKNAILYREDFTRLSEREREMHNSVHRHH